VDLTVFQLPWEYSAKKRISAVALMHAGIAIDKLRSDIEGAIGQPQGLPCPGELCIRVTPGEQTIIDQAVA
jgi:hypothetical protein